MENKIIEYLNERYTELQKIYPKLFTADKLEKAINLFGEKEDLEAIKSVVEAIISKMIEEYELAEKARLAKLSKKEKEESKGYTYSQATDVYKTLLKSFEDTGVDLYLGGGLVPYILMNEDSKRLHGDVDIVCSMNDMSKIRRRLKETAVYNAEGDSINYATDGVDYGLEFSLNGVSIGIYPFEYENGKITQYSWDSEKKLGKVKGIKLSALDNYVTEYESKDGNIYKTLALEVIKKSKDLTGRSKDIEDSQVVASYGFNQNVYESLQEYKKVAEKSFEDKKVISSISAIYHYKATHSFAKIDQKIKKYAETGGDDLDIITDAPCGTFEYLEDIEKLDSTETSEYVANIAKLKEQNPEVHISTGFIADYDQMKEEHLIGLRDKVDYMILRKEINPAEASVYYPVAYAQKLCDAMQTGLFDTVAGCADFISLREHLKTADEKAAFDRNATLASTMICNTSRDLGMPIEFSETPNQSTSLFWEIVKYSGTPVMLCGQNKNEAVLTGFNITDKKRAELRSINPKLQALYQQTCNQAYSQETHLVGKLFTNTVNSIPNNVDMKEVGCGIELMIDMSTSSVNQERESKVQDNIYRARVTEDAPVSNAEKSARLARINKRFGFIENTAKRKIEDLEKARETLHQAYENGVKDKLDLCSKAVSITESKSTKTPARKIKVAHTVISKNPQLNNKKGKSMELKPGSVNPNS